MQVVRLHDSSRQPASWMQIVRPGQFVLFAKDLDSGAPCDLEGRAFTDPSEATCAIADALAEAQTRAEETVAKVPSIRIDIFDHEGRARPALLSIVHPSRAPSADTDPRVLRKRRAIAWALIAAGIPLIVFAIVERNDREIILPAFVGINMLIAAGRLLWFNLAVRETERVRQDRLREHVHRSETPRGDR